MMLPLTQEKAPEEGTRSGELPQKRIPSESLFGPGRGREVLIVHNGREYRLRLTQNGKMILTA
jgi:hemin uptake protein HemP